MVDKAHFLQALLCRFAAPGCSQEYQDSQEAAHSVEGEQEVDNGLQDRGKHAVGVQIEQICPEQPDQHSAHQIGHQKHPLVGGVPNRFQPRFHALEQVAVFRPPVDGVFFISCHREIPLSCE